MKEVFKDRFDAGRQLASVLTSYSDKNVMVLAIPRGGVPVGYEVAKKLRTPLEIIIARKIGDPSNRELGVGAISEGGVLVLDKKVMKEIGLKEENLAQVIEEEKGELQRRIKTYRNGKPLPSFKGKTIILVDDGVARGVTALATIKAVKKLNPKSLIFATPVISNDAIEDLSSEVDNLVFLMNPEDLQAIGEYYKDFSPVGDQEVISLINEALL